MATLTAADHDHLARSIELAEFGLGRVHPNPMVGALIVRDEKVLGEGWHEECGGPHAEVNAIAAAAACGTSLQGATLYVSMEPCCHHGKTPPCTDAVIAAGIARVVVASDDPSAKASGRGLGILRDEGIEVDVGDGELAARARLVNQAFRKHARSGRPWVVFKSAMTLDGKVATRTGDSKWISGDPERRTSHALRAACDAVMVGIRTVLADDPQLTVRMVPGASPLRVVLDTTLRIPSDAQILGDAASTLLVTTERSSADRRREFTERGVGVRVVERDPLLGVDLVAALSLLRATGVRSLLVEGGAAVITSFLRARLADRVIVGIAPKIVGSGTEAVGDLSVVRVSDGLRLSDRSVHALGDDVVVAGDLA